MRKTPRPYQQDAINYAETKDGVFFAMQMRLGKSLVTLRWLESKGDDVITAIVAPKTVLLAWKDELEEEGKRYIDLTAFNIEDRKTILRTCAASGLFFLLNYETLAPMCEAIEDSSVCALVLDESTRIKNPQAHTTKAALRLSKAVAYRACLSGLPSPQGVADLFTQCAFVSGGTFMGQANFWKWRNKFFRKHGFEWVTGRTSLAKIKEAFHKEAYVLSRKDVGLQEVKVNTRRGGGFTSGVQKLYDTIADSWKIPAGYGAPEEQTKFSIVAAKWLHQLCGGFLKGKELPCWKYDEVLRILREEAPNESVVVWVAYNPEGARLVKLLNASKIKARLLVGKTKNRGQIVKDFRAGKFTVLVIQKKLGQYALRLSNANTAIYFSNSYSQEERAQSEDRTVDVEKKDPIGIYDLTTAGSIEEHIAEALKAKELNAKAVLAKVEHRRALAKC